MHKMIASVIFSFIVLFSLPAFSQYSSTKTRPLSVTISAIHLNAPLYELTTEFQLQNRLSVAVIGGVGYHKETGPRKRFWEIGGQCRLYAMGDFSHGLQLGAEFTHLRLPRARTLSKLSLTSSRTGTTIGGFLGYKYTASFGFTMDIQLGYQIAGNTSKSRNSSNSAPIRNQMFRAFSNFNLGWSF